MCVPPTAAPQRKCSDVKHCAVDGNWRALPDAEPLDIHSAVTPAVGKCSGRHRFPPHSARFGWCGDRDASSTVGGVVTSQKAPVRELAWAIVGACVGAVVRHWVDLRWPGHPLQSMCAVTAVGAGVAGFALAASMRASTKAVLIGAGGAAASISAVAARSASALPAESLLDVVIFFVAAVPSAWLGMLLGFSFSRSAQRDERH